MSQATAGSQRFVTGFRPGSIDCPRHHGTGAPSWRWASPGIAGGIVELVFGVKAERKSLEDIATPLTAVAVQRAA